MTRVWCDKRDCALNVGGFCQADEIDIQGRGSIMERVICSVKATEEDKLQAAIEQAIRL